MVDHAFDQLLRVANEKQLALVTVLGHPDPHLADAIRHIEIARAAFNTEARAERECAPSR